MLKKFAVVGAVILAVLPACGSVVSIQLEEGATPLGRLAAREVQRYIYLRTGELPSIAPEQRRGHRATIVLKLEPSLAAEAYRLQTDGDALTISGGSDLAVVYGAYRFAELLGVRFDLHRDVVPDGQVPFLLPSVDETHTPLFDTRGINPFHDFPEGPDWWSCDDYKAYSAQLAKLRLNFIGLHCYPEGGVGPEPLVWIGPRQDVDADGAVRRSYPTRWANTVGMAWGYAPLEPSKFASGAGLLFPSDDFGHPATDGYRPLPKTEADANSVFNNVGGLLNEAFTHARRLGIRTCIGTETPLTIPTPVKERLQAEGKDCADPAVVREIYRGMFARIAATHPLDYYWLWTPEGWTWSGNDPQQFAATESDINAALGALDDLGNPFTLATCGWVLGPSHDRAALDQALPKTSPMSAINRQVGHDPVDPAFSRLEGRPSWAIPWLENDPNMVGPQPWVGRMRADAVDAHTYGCTGLLGIHWRTAVMSMNVNALAQAAWDQCWATATQAQTQRLGALGGQAALFTAPVDNTEEDTIYQTVRYNLSGYRLAVPNGTYSVILKLNEPHYGEAGKRRFGAKVQGRTAVEKLDLFQQFGKNRAHDVTVKDVRVDDGVVSVDLVYDIEFPCIAGVEIAGTQDASNQFAARPYVRRINCGGGAWNGYEADAAPVASADRARSQPVIDFYLDWAGARFGPEVGERAAKILAVADGVAFPAISDWGGGPGLVKPLDTPWSDEQSRFEFVEAFAALRPDVKGAASLKRFDYWLNTFRYARDAQEARCARGLLDRRMTELGQAASPEARAAAAREALAARVALARVWERMIAHQVAAVETPGELGTICNLEQHTRGTFRFVVAHDEALVAALGKPLPATANVDTAYRGEPRIIVPTVRSLVGEGESLELRVIVMDVAPPASAHVRVRPLGGNAWHSITLEPVGRAVYLAELPPAQTSFEYRVVATTAAGERLSWPASAPEINQTVVVMPSQG